MGLETIWPRLLLCGACVMASLLGAAPVAAQGHASAIGAVIAPQKLIAAYSCTTYGEAVLLPKVEKRAKQLVEQGEDKLATLAKLLTQYDRILDGMCHETAAIFERNRNQVLDAYARQLPGNSSDIGPFLTNPRGSRWASENIEFLTATAPLHQYYAFARSIAPECLKNLRAPLDRDTAHEVRDTSAGMSAKVERARLVLLLTDDGFRELVPARFDLTSLRQEEVRLRREAATLKYATSFDWFNDNASELVRMHFGGFEAIRAMGLADVYSKYDQKLKEVLSQD